MDSQVKQLPLFKQFLWGTGGFGYVLLERMLIVYVIFFYLPPKEYQIFDLVSDHVFFGFLTAVGVAQLLARVIDGLVDPAVASLSDRCKAGVGRRKLFLLISALPMAVISVLMFYPPVINEVSFINGLWLGVMWSLFYVFYTGYLTPYFALISELGHTNALRINLGTFHGLFNLVGSIFPIVIFPVLLTYFQNTGMEIRESYQVSAIIFAVLALVFLYLATISFSEKKHCQPAKLPDLNMWKSLKTVYANKPFKILLIGELFAQFGFYMLNLGLLYYVTVIFQREEAFLVVIGGAAIGCALVSFPFINRFTKKIGKKKLLVASSLLMAIATFVAFILSFNMTGINVYISILMFGFGGIALAVKIILVIPTYGELAREEFTRTGTQREAMFYAARNLPLKFTIAFSGVVFAFLISAFGRDVADPLGVQLGILVISICSLISMIWFAFYPDKQIRESLSD